jgi:hypothetical protein
MNDMKAAIRFGLAVLGIASMAGCSVPTVPVTSAFARNIGSGSTVGRVPTTDLGTANSGNPDDPFAPSTASTIGH